MVLLQDQSGGCLAAPLPSALSTAHSRVGPCRPGTSSWHAGWPSRACTAVLVTPASITPTRYDADTCRAGWVLCAAAAAAARSCAACTSSSTGWHMPTAGDRAQACCYSTSLGWIIVQCSTMTRAASCCRSRQLPDPVPLRQLLQGQRRPEPDAARAPWSS